MRVLKDVSESSGLMHGWAYTQMGLFTRYLTLLEKKEKTIAKAVFETEPKFCWNTISRFYSTLYHTEMSWYLFFLVFLHLHNSDISA